MKKVEVMTVSLKAMAERINQAASIISILHDSETNEHAGKGHIMMPYQKAALLNRIDVELLEHADRLLEMAGEPVNYN